MKNEILPPTLREQYDALRAVNWSTLKELGRSPAHYRSRLLVPRKDTKALRLGRAVHVATLEPERFEGEYAIWCGERRAGGAWERFKATNAGREILSEKELDLCVSIQQAVRSHPAAMRYLETGASEVTVTWTDERTGIECKGRLDHTSHALVDLKSTRDASPSGFARQCARYLYHVQSAWYRDGYRAATGRELPFVLIAVEPEEPQVVQVYRLPDEALSVGADEYRRLLDRLAECRATDQWPGYADEEMELQLPRWALPDDADLAGELGLDFDGANNDAFDLEAA